MPFGFKKAPYYFSRLMAELLQGWLGKRSAAQLKVQTILDFPVPWTKTQVRAFLGIAGYYGQYIPMFSSLAAPLTELKEEFVANVVPAPFDYVGDPKRMVLLPEEVGEKGFLKTRSPTFWIDSSRKRHDRGPVFRVPTGGRRQKRALDVKWRFRCSVNK
ncbi:hypothetical protein TNCV_2732251 [Trichonephila clavipes]|nr:hypothetical protein TNCV_2732251 [Trichonephila clavipes]